MSADQERERRAREYWKVWVNTSRGTISILLPVDPAKVIDAFAADFADSETSALQAKLTAAEQRVKELEVFVGCVAESRTVQPYMLDSARRVLAGEKE